MSVDSSNPFLRCVRHLCGWATSVGASSAACAGILMYCLPGNVGAQSLMEVYRKAEAQDSQYQSARKALDATLEKLPQARASLLPGISLSANQGRQAGIASFSDAPWIDRSPSSWSWALQLTQPLLRGTNWAGYEQASAQIAQAQAQMALAQQDLILRSAQGYFDVLVAQESMRVMDAQLAAVQEQLDLAQRNFSAGTGTITDVHEAKAKHALTRSQRVAAATDLATKLAEVERLLGEPVALAPMQFASALPTMDKMLEDWRAAALTGNPQVLSQEAALEVARLEVAKNSRAHWPTLDLTASLGTNYSSGTLGSPADLSSRVESHFVGVQLTMPIYSGGGTQSRVREAIALQEKAASEWVSAQRAAQLQAQQAFLGVSNGQAQTEALLVAVAAGQNAVEGNQIGYRIGTRINPDVLNAQQQLFTSMRDLSKARAETAMQGLKLKAAVGQLQVDDLAALDQILQPTK